MRAIARGFYFSIVTAFALTAWMPAQAQAVVVVYTGTSSASGTKVLGPGESETITITLTPPSGQGSSYANLTTPTLQPDSGPFAITGGTCDTDISVTAGGQPTTCTVVVTNTSAAPATAQAALSIGCITSVRHGGGYMFTCSYDMGTGSVPSTPGVVAQFSSAVAASAVVAVDTMGPMGLTLMALFLFGLASAMGLRKRS